MSNEWYTPAKYIEAARSVMGSIDLDPASCELANQTVRAARYYTKEDNGLMHPWYGRVWLNPPFGTTSGNDHIGRSNLGLFAKRLDSEYRVGHVEQAVLLANADPAAWFFRYLWDYPICFVESHIYFHRPGMTQERRRCGECFVYLGSNEQAFIDTFSKFGRIAKAIDTPVARPRQLELVS